MDTEKINLKGYTREELEQFVEGIGAAGFHGRQLFSWIYQKRVSNFEMMTNLARDLRTKLQTHAVISTLTKIESIISPGSGTIKYLFELTDGYRIESVFIPEGDRRTLCVSSQVGCPLGCIFCATGNMGYRRNLTTGEIVDQVIQVENELGVELTNIVFMGMGEPMLNYENVIKASQLISHPDGIAIGQKRIVISTVGWIPGINRYTDEGHRFKLAISLHATTDKIRTRLMPIGRKFKIKDLLEAAKYYAQKSHRRLTFEYLLIYGINDTVADAKRLREMLQNIPCKLNLIPLNPINEMFKRPPAADIDIFARWLYPLTAPVTVRWSKGQDIQGACGQLAGK